MAPRRTRRIVTTRTTVENPPENPSDNPDASPGDRDESEREIEAAISEVGGGTSKCFLSRFDDTSARWVRVCTLEATQVTQDFIQSNFGGGRYRGSFRNGAGQWGKTFTVDIDKRIPAKLPAWVMGTPEKPAERTNGDASGSDAADDRDFKNLYKMRMLDLLDQSDRLRARSEEMAARSAEQHAKMMDTMMTSTSALLANIGKTPAAPAGPSMKELLDMQAASRKETIEMMRELKGPATEPPTIDKTLALMTKLREASGGFLEEREGLGEAMASPGCWLRPSKPSSRSWRPRYSPKRPRRSLRGGRKPLGRPSPLLPCPYSPKPHPRSHPCRFGLRSRKGAS